jgi:hypothetical protein
MDGRRQTNIGLFGTGIRRGNGPLLFERQTLFDGHILEFTGLKDLAAELTLYVLGVFFA